MPKLLTDEQIANIKSAMDLLEKTDKKNKELINQVKELKDINKVLSKKVQDLEEKIDDFEVVDDEQFSSYFSYLYKKQEK